MNNDKLCERLADVQHDIWAHWMRYMFSCGNFNDDGSWSMPEDKVERWQRQMNTTYADLTDKERESDREQASKVLSEVNAQLDAANARADSAETLSYDIAANAAVEAQKSREELTAMKQRAEAAEAKLAAVPVEAIRSIVDVAVIAGLGDGPLGNEMATVTYWLSQRTGMVVIDG